MMNSPCRMFASLDSVMLASMGVIGSHFSRIEPPVRSAPAAAPRRTIKPPKVKGIRTVRAEGAYGRNLRTHFDDVKRTPAQRNAFQKTLVARKLA